MMKTKRKKRFRLKSLSVLLAAGLLAGMVNASTLAAAGSQEEVFEETSLEQQDIQAKVLEDIPETTPEETKTDVPDVTAAETKADIPETVPAEADVQETMPEETKADVPETVPAEADVSEIVSEFPETREELAEEETEPTVLAGAADNLNGGFRRRAAGRMCEGESKLNVGWVIVDKDNKETGSYQWPRSTPLPCNNTREHSYNATHGFPYSAIKECGPAGSIGYSRANPGGKGTKVTVYP